MRKRTIANLVDSAFLFLVAILPLALYLITCLSYKLQSSTASVPSKPTTNPPPSGWNDSEPSYTSESTNTLYFCDLSVFSDGTFSYSAVSKSRIFCNKIFVYS